ncbi:MAG TPA: hypothetical protein VLS93_02300 [Anaeromyxobacteraceae bacterium]|nr:hypothetical protein [Anaeromyxobacteraceae bacterium]
MDALTSAAGSLGLAISALLVVLGFRLARPGGGAEWLAFAAYAAAVAATFAAGLERAGAPGAPGTPLRLAGGAALVAGLLVAGSAASRARRPPRPGGPPAAGEGRAGPWLPAGFALALAGHLLRNPSRAGAIATATAVVLQAWVALRGRRGADGIPGPR